MQCSCHIWGRKTHDKLLPWGSLLMPIFWCEKTLIHPPIIPGCLHKLRAVTFGQRTRNVCKYIQYKCIYKTKGPQALKLLRVFNSYRYSTGWQWRVSYQSWSWFINISSFHHYNRQYSIFCLIAFEDSQIAV